MRLPWTNHSSCPLLPCIPPPPKYPDFLKTNLITSCLCWYWTAFHYSLNIFYRALWDMPCWYVNSLISNLSSSFLFINSSLSSLSRTFKGVISSLWPSPSQSLLILESWTQLSLSPTGLPEPSKQGLAHIYALKPLYFLGIHELNSN